MADSTTKSMRFMGFASGNSSTERGEAVRSQPVSSRMPEAMPQLRLIIGNLVVR